MMQIHASPKETNLYMSFSDQVLITDHYIFIKDTLYKSNFSLYERCLCASTGHFLFSWSWNKSGTDIWRSLGSGFPPHDSWCCSSVHLFFHTEYTETLEHFQTFPFGHTSVECFYRSLNKISYNQRPVYLDHTIK